MTNRRRLTIELATAAAALSAVGAAMVAANDPEEASHAIGVMLVLLGFVLYPFVRVSVVIAAGASSSPC